MPNRFELLRSKSVVVGQFMDLMVPILVDVYAAHERHQVRAGQDARGSPRGGGLALRGHERVEERAGCVHAAQRGRGGFGLKPSSLEARAAWEAESGRLIRKRRR